MECSRNGWRKAQASEFPIGIALLNSQCSVSNVNAKTHQVYRKERAGLLYTAESQDMLTFWYEKTTILRSDEARGKKRKQREFIQALGFP